MIWAIAYFVVGYIAAFVVSYIDSRAPAADRYLASMMTCIAWLPILAMAAFYCIVAAPVWIVQKLKHGEE